MQAHHRQNRKKQADIPNSHDQIELSHVNICVSQFPGSREKKLQSLANWLEDDMRINALKDLWRKTATW